MQATPGVSYVRAILPARHLPGKVCQLSELDLKWVGKKDGEDQFQFPRQEGAAIWSFSGNNSRALMMAEMMNQGVPVFVEMDDNYQKMPPYSQLSQWKTTRAARTPVVAKSRYAGLKDRVVTFEDDHALETATGICGFADGMIVSTPKIAEAYAGVNSNIHVCENTVDPDDWPDPPEPSEKLRVGWAASDSHRYDAPLIRDALAWASTRKNVEVVIMGIHPDVSRFRFPYHYVPWTGNVAKYRQNVGLIDVMLCPLQRGEWEDCKSDLKALEAAMGGACAVMSDGPPYSPWKDKPGYFAKNDMDFTRLLKHLCRNPDEARETAILAREHVLANRSIRGNIHKWRDAICSA